MNKIIVTGGSGFIGSNLIPYLLSKRYKVLNIDKVSPPYELDSVYYRFVKCNILTLNDLRNHIIDYNPDYIIHLAAETKLSHMNNPDFYLANTTGVQNIISLTKNLSNLKKIIYASTKLVCEEIYDDIFNYNATTKYGMSKIEGEKYVLNSNIKAESIIVRPSSHWGPWSLCDHIPYGRFFKLIERGLYFHPKIADKRRDFGFVGNTCYQLVSLLETKKTIDKEVFYLADYESFYIKDWAKKISLAYGKSGNIITIPNLILYLTAFLGDLLKYFGVKEPYFSSFRLKNMAKETLVPIKKIKNITGNLPYTLEEGIFETVKWLKNN